MCDYVHWIVFRQTIVGKHARLYDELEQCEAKFHEIKLEKNAAEDAKAKVLDSAAGSIGCTKVAYKLARELGDDSGRCTCAIPCPKQSWSGTVCSCCKHRCGPIPIRGCCALGDSGPYFEGAEVEPELQSCIVQEVTSLPATAQCYVSGYEIEYTTQTQKNELLQFHGKNFRP